MNIRPLSNQEALNLDCLNSAGITSTLLFVTGTGLSKSILDATEPMRALLEKEGVHTYSSQGQGIDHKKILNVFVHTKSGAIGVPCSFYRPLTKKGDPRFWPARFGEHAGADSVCALFVTKGHLHILNLTETSLGIEMGAGIITSLSAFFLECRSVADSVADELLSRLRSLASFGPLESVCSGDTAIGRTIETALGISINSSRNPDYHGIEIKAGRSSLVGRETRSNLFACVPDWSLSRCKSSRQIIDELGYQRENNAKLYCTVSAIKQNSQGLIFNIDHAERFLRENCMLAPPREIAVWRLSHLEERLALKHRETFWVKAQSISRKGKEFFDLKSVLHTRNPNIPQFERMIEEGSITMDHLIKVAGKSAQEKGPLFKIVKNKIPELFLGTPKFHSLT
jgi:hypothetical protein